MSGLLVTAIERVKGVHILDRGGLWQVTYADGRTERVFGDDLDVPVPHSGTHDFDPPRLVEDKGSGIFETVEEFRCECRRLSREAIETWAWAILLGVAAGTVTFLGLVMA